MPWKHRVAKQITPYSFGIDGEEVLYSIREFFYDDPEIDNDDNDPDWEPVYGPGGNWTMEPIAPTAESLDGLEWVLERMLEAVKEAKEDESLIIDDDD